MKLEMDEEKRKYKWGRYGIGKYVYPDEAARDLEKRRGYVETFFPNATVPIYFT